MPKIALLLAEGFADWEYALIAGTGGPFYSMETAFFTPNPGPVLSQGGLEAMVPKDLSDIAAWQPDALVVVGGVIWESENAPDITPLLRDLHASGTVIAGICGGTLALARAGLLDQVEHTSNDPDFLIRNAAGYQGAAGYVESASAVSDHGIITAPGTAPVSFAAAVFARLGLDADATGQFRQMLAAEHM